MENWRTTRKYNASALTVVGDGRIKTTEAACMIKCYCYCGGQYKPQIGTLSASAVHLPNHIAYWRRKHVAAKVDAILYFTLYKP